MAESIKYIGASTHDLDLFEGQYSIPNGMAYNSYVIDDEKIAIMDTVDKIVTDKWLENLKKALDGREPEYLVVQHLEPDHSGNINTLLKMYPHLTLVCTAKAKAMLEQFDIEAENVMAVKEGDELSLGSHTLKFILAPMVHWPEVMITYEESEKALFSADAFGKFGALDVDEDWSCEARKYYFNIVGKYGAQVQALLKKVSALEIKMICPLHGPMLTEGLEEYLRLYDLWSQWKPEEPEGILIAHASIHGNTAYASEALKSKLEGKGAQVTMCDLTATDLSYAVTSAFYCGKLVLACSTYDGGLFPPMKEFLEHLQTKGFRNRRIGLMENGSWAPAAARLMRAELEKMKELRLCETEVSLRGALNQTSEAQMDALVAELCAE